jgi:hypothetical protein
MHHDPERDAAAYLAGEFAPLRRLWFERHLLECADCWRETDTARRGRMLAEGLRQVAPASARDRIRAVADIPPDLSADVCDAPGRRRWPYLLAVATAMLVLLAALALPRLAQPPVLTATADLLHAPTLSLEATPAPAIHAIGSYGWRGTTRRDVGGIPATVYAYADPHGHRILLLASTSPFPRAWQARDLARAPGWMATVDGVSLLCADRGGLSWLAAAPDDATALMAGRTLGLTRG